MIENLSINLQLFNGEKTEEPTPKKRRDAREEGQIVQSKEVNTVVILFSCFLGLKYFGNIIINELQKFMVVVFESLYKTDIVLNQNNIMVNFMKTIAIYAIASLPILLVAFTSALIVNYLQVGFLFTTKTLKLKLDRLNPIEGFKRMFSKKAVVELIKSILKLVLVGFVVYKYAESQIETIVKYPNMEIKYFFLNFSNMLYQFVKKILGILLAVALFDYFFQWRSHEKNLMMTKQEIKEEYKQSEGDPFIKGKIKEKQREMAMSRMMQDVPQADVIITNPTHFAVAIKYEPDKYDAPYLIAKGADLIAHNIKAVGKEHDIPIVENKILARTIYSTVDINELVPEELYELVAEVLAYVYSLREEI